MGERSEHCEQSLKIQIFQKGWHCCRQLTTATTFQDSIQSICEEWFVCPLSQLEMAGCVLGKTHSADSLMHVSSASSPASTVGPPDAARSPPRRWGLLNNPLETPRSMGPILSENRGMPHPFPPSQRQGHRSMPAAV